MPGDRGRPQTIPILDWHAEALHERARVLAEALLSRNERIAVVGVFHRALVQVVGDAHVVMRAEDEARAFALEELAHRLDLLRSGFLFGDHVIEAEHHQRVGVGEHALVDRKRWPGLVDALVDGTRAVR